MKICPACNLTYADDSLVFCVNDGARLSASYDPQATVRLPKARETDPQGTEILPQQATPIDREAGPFHAMNPALAPPTFPQASTAATSRAGRHWLIVSATLALIVVGLVALFGYFAFRVGTSTASRQLNVPATNVEVPNSPNRNSQSPQWLEGVWEGRGYQSDTKTNWLVKLRVQDGRGAVDYPSIPCLGRWNLIESDTGQAKFIEVITQGLDRCTSDSNVTIQKVKADQISCMYTYSGSGAVIATAILTKKAETPEQK